MVQARLVSSFPFFLTSHAKLLCFVDRLRVSASFKLHPSSFYKLVSVLHLLTGCFPNKVLSRHLASEAGGGEGRYQTGDGGGGGGGGRHQPEREGGSKKSE